MKVLNIPVFSCLLTSLLCGCSSIPKQSSSPSTSSAGYKETGKASHYGAKHQSKMTASGDRFNQYSNTAAHRTLPFGETVKVTNINNGKSVMVTINDRGPFGKARIIDLSQSAFSTIAKLEEGIITVEIEAIQ